MRDGRIRTLLLAAVLLASLLGIMALSGSAGAAASSHQGAEPIPNCPAAGPQCRIDIALRQGRPLDPCDSFTASDGACIGSSVGTAQWIEPSYEPKFGLQTMFTWKSSGPVRFVDYQAHAGFTILRARIVGRVPSPGSAEFVVTDASISNSSTTWQTGSSGQPGSPGGPLYLDYDNKTAGARIHIYGVLDRK
jgi:hypothetical protein